MDKTVTPASLVAAAKVARAGASPKKTDFSTAMRITLKDGASVWVGLAADEFRQPIRGLFRVRVRCVSHPQGKQGTRQAGDHLLCVSIRVAAARLRLNHRTGDVQLFRRFGSFLTCIHRVQAHPAAHLIVGRGRQQGA